MEFATISLICFVCGHGWTPDPDAAPMCPKCPAPKRFFPTKPGFYWMMGRGEIPHIVDIREDSPDSPEVLKIYISGRREFEYLSDFRSNKEYEFYGPLRPPRGWDLDEDPYGAEILQEEEKKAREDTDRDAADGVRGGDMPTHFFHARKRALTRFRKLLGIREPE